MKQALEALEHLHRTGDTQVFDLCYAPEVIPSLRQAIEQYEKQEPVATIDSLEQEIYENTREFVSLNVMEWLLKRLNTTPQPQREWVGLTEDDRNEILIDAAKHNWDDRLIVKQMEAKLKERNGGNT